MEFSKKQIWFYGLLVGCPQGNPLTDCPLEKYRNGSWEDKLHAMEILSEQKMDRLIQQHNTCLLGRV